VGMRVVCSKYLCNCVKESINLGNNMNKNIWVKATLITVQPPMAVITFFYSDSFRSVDKISGIKGKEAHKNWTTELLTL
jgi:hypothetical protein